MVRLDVAFALCVDADLLPQAYLALLAILADRSFTLPRIGNLQSAQEVLYDHQAHLGALHLYHDVTRKLRVRWLRGKSGQMV